VPKIFLKGIKGGTGTTTLTANLACMLKKSNLNVLAIELDQKSDLGLHFGVPWSETSGWSHAKNVDALTDCFYRDNDGVLILPYGSQATPHLSPNELIENIRSLQLADNTWIIIDCPSTAELHEYPIAKTDIVIELVNCDAICHSFMYKRLAQLTQIKNNWQHYFLANKYNSSSALEFDLYALWQTSMPLIAPFFINHDEIIKESTAYKNVALNCAPYSIANDDFETLAGWLVSKISK
jgi:cellulose synthase operon protein YhjQ